MPDYDDNDNNGKISRRAPYTDDLTAVILDRRDPLAITRDAVT